jgi:hypothetical protein
MKRSLILKVFPAAAVVVGLGSLLLTPAVASHDRSRQGQEATRPAVSSLLAASSQFEKSAALPLRETTRNQESPEDDILTSTGAVTPGYCYNWGFIFRRYF